jgi:hypothetical protein
MLAVEHPKTFAVCSMVYPLALSARIFSKGICLGPVDPCGLFTAGRFLVGLSISTSSRTGSDLV